MSSWSVPSATRQRRRCARRTRSSWSSTRWKASRLRIASSHNSCAAAEPAPRRGALRRLGLAWNHAGRRRRGAGLEGPPLPAHRYRGSAQEAPGGRQGRGVLRAARAAHGGARRCRGGAHGRDAAGRRSGRAHRSAGGGARARRDPGGEQVGPGAGQGRGGATVARASAAAPPTRRFRPAPLHQRAGRDSRAPDPRARCRAARRSVHAHPDSAAERVGAGDAGGAPGAALPRFSRPVQLRLPGGDAAGDHRHPVQPAAGRRRRVPPVPGESPARAFRAARSRASDLPAEEPFHAARLRGSGPVNAMDLGARNIGSPPLWAGFLVAVVIVLAVDLKISARDQSSTFKEAVWWSVFWIVLSVGFGFFVWFRYGGEQGLEYFAGYLLEKSLSVDNLFVFVLLFRSFAIPPRHQHRVPF